MLQSLGTIMSPDDVFNNMGMVIGGRAGYISAAKTSILKAKKYTSISFCFLQKNKLEENNAMESAQNVYFHNNNNETARAGSMSATS